ncbi:MAG: hypothetical protein V4604_14970 [Bacteroidota bacterium]
MKNYFLVMAIAGLSTTAFAQQTENKPTRELKPLKSEATGAKPLVAPAADSLEGETLEHLDAWIQAIDNKVEHVNSDQTMREKALADGWFDQMARHRERAVARREALIARNATK